MSGGWGAGSATTCPVSPNPCSPLELRHLPDLRSWLLLAPRHCPVPTALYPLDSFSVSATGRGPRPSPAVGPPLVSSGPTPSPSVTLGLSSCLSGPRKAASRDWRRRPHPPPPATMYKRPLAGPGRHHPVLFSSPNTAVPDFSGSRPLMGSPLSQSLFAFWLRAVLWVLLGTPAPLALDFANWNNSQ